MTRGELLSIIAAKLDNPNTTAEVILDTIFAELKEPTEDMMKTIGATSVQRLIWQKMLAASPLAPKGGKD